MSNHKEKIAELNQVFSTLDLSDALRKLTEIFSGKITLSSSLGPEDQVITDSIFRNKLGIEIFTLDTGRLFAESYNVLDQNKIFRFITQRQRQLKTMFLRKESMLFTTVLI